MKILTDEIKQKIVDYVNDQRYKGIAKKYRVSLKKAKQMEKPLTRRDFETGTYSYETWKWFV